MAWTSPDAARSHAAADLVDAIAQRYVGTVVEVDAGGHAARFLLEHIHLDPTPARTGGVAEALRNVPRTFDRVSKLGETLVVRGRDVDLGGRSIDAAELTADGVTIELGRQPFLVTGPIVIDARISRAGALALFGGAIEGWTIALRDDGLVDARQEGRKTVLVAEPSFAADQVTMTVLRVRVVGREVRLPQRYVQRRTFTIPPLAPTLALLDVHADGDDIVFRMQHDGVRHPVHLDDVRKAIVNGVTNFLV